MRPTGAVRVREAYPVEARALLALVVAIDAETDFLPREPGERPVWCVDRPEEDLAAFQARGNSTVFVAERDGVLVGHLSASGGRYRRNRGVATLSAGVRREARGSGIGRALFAAAHLWAARRGLHRLELTVAEGNPAAAFYDRLGYATEGVMRHTRRVAGGWRDEQLMARLLTPAEAEDWEPFLPEPPEPESAPVPVVRQAEPDDALAYLLCDRAVRSETPFLLRTVRESLEDEAAARLFLAGQKASANAATLVAVLPDGRIAGTLSLWQGRERRAAHEASLGMAVRAPFWRAGIGSRLTDAAVGWCRWRGLHRLSLWVMGHNEWARRFYAGRGFEVEATARRCLVIDGRYADQVLMARLFPESA